MQLQLSLTETFGPADFTTAAEFINGIRELCGRLGLSLNLPTGAPAAAPASVPETAGEGVETPAEAEKAKRTRRTKAEMEAARAAEAAKAEATAFSGPPPAAPSAPAPVTPPPAQPSAPAAAPVPAAAMAADVPAAPTNAEAFRPAVMDFVKVCGADAWNKFIVKHGYKTVSEIAAQRADEKDGSAAAARIAAIWVPMVQAIAEAKAAKAAAK